MKVLGIIALCFWVFLLILILNPFNSKIITIPVDETIEEAVQANNFDYKFIEWRKDLLSQAGAGGQGAAVIWLDSPEDFMAETPKGEKIYTVVQSSSNNSNLAEKVYVAGVQDREFLLGYKEVYRPPSGASYNELVSFTNNEIIYKQFFKVDYYIALIVCFFFVGVIAVFLLAFPPPSMTELKRDLRKEAQKYDSRYRS